MGRVVGPLLAKACCSQLSALGGLHDGVGGQGGLNISVVPVALEAVLEVPVHCALEAILPAGALLPACAQHVSVRSGPTIWEQHSLHLSCTMQL